MFLAAEGCEGQSQCYGPVAEGSVDPSSFKSMCSFCAEGRGEKSNFSLFIKEHKKLKTQSTEAEPQQAEERNTVD